jgi:RNA polymerase sigma-70 factor (ECF subfamily)
LTERDQEDQILISRAQGGDQSALNALIRKYEARAYTYAFRLTRNSEEAADVTAEAFVRVFHALPNFKGQSAFGTWIYRILTNCFLDMRKKDKGRTVSLEATVRTPEGDLERQFEDPSDTPQDKLEKDDRSKWVRRAIRSLPEYQRAMIVMFHAEGRTYEDIAAALDLPIGTVKSRLNRARLTLRELMARDEELFRS